MFCCEQWTLLIESITSITIRIIGCAEHMLNIMGMID